MNAIGVRPWRIYVPWLDRGQIGLGSLLQRLTTKFCIKPCAACNARAAALDNALVFESVNVFFAPAQATPCWRFRGRCTGFGRMQCVSGPEAQTPDALIIQQCCSGWFQYPWIEVCPGKTARRGCGFCLG